MNSPYKKYLLYTDLLVQVLFLASLLIGGIALASDELFNTHIGGFMLLPLLMLWLMALLNPLLNVFHLVLGTYSDETQKLRSNYLKAIGIYIAVGIVGAILLNIPSLGATYIASPLSWIYVFIGGNIFAIVASYITILEYRSKKVMEKRLFY